MGTMIVAENLHKAFKTKTGLIKAVENVGFHAEDGQITGLLGPNGAGKTTTMRMLYTLMTPDQGKVLVDGIDAAADAVAVRRRLGVLPDARGVYKRLTARENIAYFGQLHGMNAAQIRDRTQVLSRALDMEDILDRQTDGFSQGQRTKTAIARALVLEPQLLVLDEPTSSLDRSVQKQILTLLRSLQQQRQLTYLFISHDLQVVRSLCHQVMVLRQGEVVEHGDCEKLFAAPAADYTRELLASAQLSDR